MIKSIYDFDFSGHKVLVRVDFNVPLDSENNVTDDNRIRESIPTIDKIIDDGGIPILMSHLGRPKGERKPKYSLKPVADYLKNKLGYSVIFAEDCVGEQAKNAVNNAKIGDIVLLENLRFHKEEELNDSEFARKLASLGDVYVNDAFGAAHRSHASTVGVTKYLPAVAGLLLEKEVSVLNKLIEAPNRPFVACLGGNKVSDKIGVFRQFLKTVNAILTGGGMCFTFLKAKRLEVGRSLVEENQINFALNIMEEAKKQNVSLYLPVDVVVAPEMSPDAAYKVVSVTSIPKDWLGLDIGPETVQIYQQVLESAKTAFWNGPMGVFEIEQFAAGTKAIAEGLADATRHGCLTIVGGGDSLAALKKFNLEDKVSFASTGGGASLKMLEGTSLPGVEALLDREKS
jgi:phosphoglycerate kinase